jgi:EpsD family peptidyl-prolyl cis-trans isomerase
MKLNWAYALAAVACVSLAGCNKDKVVGAKGPAGQVVATVDGQEITVRELRAELGGATFSDAKIRKAAETRALQAIVNRRLLVKAAQERGLDKTPDFELQKERALDAALVQELQNSIAKTVPPATREEAERYIIEHPDIFAQRKIFVVDQIRTPQPMSPAVVEALKPLNTLEEVETLFNQQRVSYERSIGKIDAAVSEPKLVESIVAMKPGMVFALPVGQVMLINRVKETKVQPYTGDDAVAYAQQRLTREHAQEALVREYNAILAKGKDKVQYNKDYQPGGKVADASGAKLTQASSVPGNGG